MNYSIPEIFEYIEENDVKFIRLAFCDLLGRHKNIAVTPDKLREALERGVAVDMSALSGFSDAGKTDVCLVPDPSTLNILPWRPDRGRVARFFCDLKTPDGTDFPFDSRRLLKTAAARAAAAGFTCKVGTESEFYLFLTDERGQPTKETYDLGGYLDIAPLDKCENVRREICLNLENMGIRPEYSKHEKGPGQNEIVFAAGDILSAADNFLTYKALVKATAASNGLFASFMPKPLPDKPGSGLHLKFSLINNGVNIFSAKSSAAAESFTAGVMAAAAEMTAFLNPTVNSYGRLGTAGAPNRVTWGRQNLSQLVRVISSTENGCMELRSPDSALNPYAAFALLLHAGLDGIEGKLKLPAAGTAVKGQSLPASLPEALALGQKSTFIQKALGSEFAAAYFAALSGELVDYEFAGDKDEWLTENYFMTL